MLSTASGRSPPPPLFPPLYLSTLILSRLASHTLPVCLTCLAFARSVLEYGVVGDRLIMEGPEEEGVDRQLYLILGGNVRIEVRGSRVAKLG